MKAIDKLERWMGDHEVSRYKLSNLMNCSPTTVSKLLNGHVPGLAVLAKLKVVTGGAVELSDWVEAEMLDGVRPYEGVSGWSFKKSKDTGTIELNGDMYRVLITRDGSASIWKGHARIRHQIRAIDYPRNGAVDLLVERAIRWANRQIKRKTNRMIDSTRSPVVRCGGCGYEFQISDDSQLRAGSETKCPNCDSHLICTGAEEHFDVQRNEATVYWSWDVQE